MCLHILLLSVLNGQPDQVCSLAAVLLCCRKLYTIGRWPGNSREAVLFSCPRPASVILPYPFFALPSFPFSPLFSYPSDATLAPVSLCFRKHLSEAVINPIKAELNPIRHLLALVGARIKSHPPFASIGRSSN